MPSQSYEPRIPVEIDAELIDWVDQIIDQSRESDSSPRASHLDRTQAIEAAIRDWCKQQTSRRLQHSADLHRQRHNNDETGWLV